MLNEFGSWQANIADIVNDQYRILLRLGYCGCLDTFKAAVLYVAEGLSDLGHNVSVDCYFNYSYVHFYGSAGGHQFSLHVSFPKFEVQ